MWNEIAAELALFEGAAIFSIVGILFFAAANFAVVRYGKWSSPAYLAYGLFGGLKGARLSALVFLLLRSLFFISLPFGAGTLQAAYLWYGGLLTVGIYLLLSDWRMIPFDLLYTASIYALLYGQSKIHENNVSLQRSWLGAVLPIAVGLLVILLSIVLCLKGMESLTRISRSFTAARRKQVLPQLLLPLAAGLASLLLVATLGQAGTLTINEPLFQNNSGKIITYNGYSTIKRTGDTCTLQATGGEPQKLLTGPLYYKNQDKIVTTTVSILVQPKLSAINRLASMSQITKTGGGYTVETDNGASAVSDFFLFDGKNSYLFFEPVTLMWGDQSFTAPAFSYINVQYGSSLEVFDRNTGKLTQLNTGADDVSVTMQCQAKINLSSDILYGTNGQQQILFIQPNLLQDFN